ncbi:hypothetical protein MP228_004496 [Amoeboaphelidium protococcarum]|nr:hypothetical protein MP228_004496 [Amoeboaphelidium protococcarum]
MQSFLLNVASYLTPVNTVSTFKDTGRLTPEEFIAAGDFLSMKCPSWKWESGEDSKRKDYLNSRGVKQYLCAKGVQCTRRVADIFNDQVVREVTWQSRHDGDNDSSSVEGDWVGYVLEVQDDDEPEIVDIDDETVAAADGGSGNQQNKVQGQDDKSTALQQRSADDESSKVKNDPISGKSEQIQDQDDDDDEDIPDIEELMIEEDPAAAVSDNMKNLPPPPSQMPQQDTSSMKSANQLSRLNSAVSNTSSNQMARKYDLYITYDKYYQTPRLWLQGYFQGKPLKPKDIFQDISQDHANKTVTVEEFPHLSMIHMVCVHPCKHAAVMKKLMDMFQSSGNEIRVDQYMVVFLKFMNAIIPTIEYDNTSTV